MARLAKTTTKDIESFKHREARGRTSRPRSSKPSCRRASRRRRRFATSATPTSTRSSSRGKDEQDAEDLMVGAVPIYIQEKIQPETIIRDLMRRF
jgi:adenine-specific DNA-methyltransferase